MAEPRFYDANAFAKIAIDLFHGWGYDFYRKENQLRADDLVVRARVSELLGAARISVATAEKAFRREFLPPPTREKPRPDADAVRGAQDLESLGRAIGAVEGRIRALPVPENDRMTQRFRREAETLSRLVEADQTMVAQAEFFRAVLATANAEWMLKNATSLREQIIALEATVQGRRDLLAF